MLQEKVQCILRDPIKKRETCQGLAQRSVQIITGLHFTCT